MHYAATIFLSSFLLFVVQPLIARLILPWFGGSAAVWTTCMLFFQALLLAGYAYAHGLVRLVPGRVPQAAVHTALLAIAAATLPIAPAESWKPDGSEEPVSHILLLLAGSVGLPYFVLASTSPLIQAWYSRAHPERNPYRLFALSNFASLVALIGYPLVIEPFFAGREQVAAWSWLFAAFALACGVAAWLTPRATTAAEEAGAAQGPLPWVLWLSLSAAGSVMLLAVTNHLTQNVAAVPMLWLAPLTLYLLTFILAFEGRGAYRPAWMWSCILVALAAMGWLVVDERFHFDLPVQLGIFLTGLFAACMFCHGELYRSRPAARHLTAFYLTISAGGALGGILVAIVAPLVFDAYYELGIGIVAVGVLAAVCFRALGRVPQYASLAVLFAVAGAVAYAGFTYHKDVRVSSRSFYGVMRVKEYGAPGDEGHLRRLVHGAIMHGEQYMTGPWRAFITSYYQETAGIGLAIRAKQATGAVRVGVIGLGTGTLAAYGRAGDVFRFYDIDPRVVDVARSEFTYLGDSAARIEVALGDARLALERESAREFDVLAVDAFSGDAIPVHLITREALRVYLRQVKADGIVAFHVSNRFLNLVPVVARLAKEEGAHAVLVTDDPEEDDQSRRSRTDWVLVSKSRAALEAPKIVEGGAVPAEDRPEWRTWTDDYSNLVQIVK